MKKRKVGKSLNKKQITKIIDDLKPVKKRKYKVKITPKLKKTLKKYWDMLQAVNEGYEIEVAHIEEKMEKATRIKGIEFFRSIPKKCWKCEAELLIDPSVCGIGNYEKTMPFWQDL